METTYVHIISIRTYQSIFHFTLPLFLLMVAIILAPDRYGTRVFVRPCIFKFSIKKLHDSWYGLCRYIHFFYYCGTKFVLYQCMNFSFERSVMRSSLYRYMIRQRRHNVVVPSHRHPVDRYQHERRHRLTSWDHSGHPWWWYYLVLPHSFSSSSLPLTLRTVRRS